MTARLRLVAVHPPSSTNVQPPSSPDLQTVVLEACRVTQKAATLLAMSPKAAERQSVADVLAQVADALRRLP